MFRNGPTPQTWPFHATKFVARNLFISRYTWFTEGEQYHAHGIGDHGDVALSLGGVALLKKFINSLPP
jgi:hypothetical protein